MLLAKIGYSIQLLRQRHPRVSGCRFPDVNVPPIQRQTKILAIGLLQQRLGAAVLCLDVDNRNGGLPKEKVHVR